jgi:ABC-2 type transport system permease protein
MLAASLYIVLCSAKNRVRVRLRRLREPRYLVGAIAGAAYLYFAVFARMLGTGRARRRGFDAASPLFGPAWQRLATAIGGVGLLTLAGLAWVLPTGSTLLDFSEAEVHLLFPSPVSRRALVCHRLIRSQIGFLFASFVAAFFVTAPQLSAVLGFRSIEARLQRLFAFWILFLTLRLYLAGVTLARAHLGSREPQLRRVAWAPLIVTASAVGAVVVALARSFTTTPVSSARELGARIADITATGGPWLATLPFTSLIRPFFAESAAAYLTAVGPALIVLLVMIEWVLRTDAIFLQGEDVSPAPAVAKTPSARTPQVRAVQWPLPLSGRTESVFFWKNGLQTLRGTNVAHVVPILIPVTILSVIVATARMSATQAQGPAAGFATGSLMVAAFFTLLGPQAMRSDLRGDLPHLDLLKTWPVKAAAIIRGELLWPTTVLTLCAWLAIACAAILSAAAFPDLDLPMRISLSIAAFLLVPALIATQFTVHNAAATLFPAWVPTGTQRPRGFDAMGQRIILLGGVLLALAVMVGPGIIAGGIVGFLLYPLIGPASVVLGSAICLAVSLVEILLATEMLGGALERMDLSDAERAE